MTATVLVLRTSNADGTSHNGFRWPTEGPVTCPDWQPTDECGHGLHGALWGEGDGELFRWGPGALWQVVEVPADTIVDLGGKVKFPAGVVMHTGTQQTATAYVVERAPGRAVIGATVTAGYDGTATTGDRGTATAGDYGMAVAGYRGTAVVGDNGTATAGNYGSAVAGYNGMAVVGDNGTATAGNYGSAVAGYNGMAVVGDNGSAVVGDNGTATAGDGGTLVVKWHDGGRYRLAVGYVGEDGIEPNVAYRCDAAGKLVRVDGAA